MSEKEAAKEAAKEAEKHKKEPVKKPKRERKKSYSVRDTPPKNPSTPWLDKNGQLHMAKIDLLELEAVRNKMLNTESQASALKLQADKDELQSRARISGLREQSLELEKQHEELKHKYTMTLVRIGKRYNVNFLYHHAYETDSGVIQRLHPDSPDEEDKNL